ncbi:Phytochrome, two-component sensor histidine kinase [Myxococcus hansupus]|uniref:histidine kinase n=1 Tax=Pseudomyxococcus hansupus TaxID=1297742 RepID=A0A0H4X663_9BACT|nr:ATP-binding protein [Myxococcus hansupus]AKQ69060.1 Phytochrome, two-component sensor histidine kinase [Myxococcus hansupus]
MPHSPPDLDLGQCDREPIHLLGGIQPHGVLVAFHPETLRIEVVSGNAEPLLGQPPSALRGQSITAVLDEAALRRVRAQSLIGPVAVQAGGRACSALLHASDGLQVLELEPLTEAMAQADEAALSAIHALVSPLGQVRGASSLLQRAADGVRALIGFDRVMVYRFHADWHGEVVAESLAEGVESFMGLHYPASDIPVQARALYRRNPLRLIADVQARPVGMVPPTLPGTGQPLDLSGAALRSVSEIHLEYLRNMGVGASFSVSLLKDGELWGLMACHHHAPRLVSAARRQACEVLARMLALQLGAEERGADATAHARRATLLARLVSGLGEGTSLPAALKANGALLMELTGATGVALLLGESLELEQGEQPVLLGRTPSREEVLALASRLAEMPGASTTVHTERLETLHPPLAGRADVAAGLLSVRLDPQAPRFVFWFRPEVARTVAWAGNPNKPARPEPGHTRLHPRASFEAWREEVRGASVPWSSADVEAAESFQGALVGVVLRHAVELSRVSRALARSNAELESFSGTVGHDLREPLRGIQQYTSFFLEDHGASLANDSREQLQAVGWLARRAQSLLEDLFEYSRLGRIELAWHEVDMHALVEEALAVVSPRLVEGKVEVRQPRRLPRVACDDVRIRQVWENLLSNAAKYQAQTPHWVELGYFGPGEERTGAAARHDAPYVFFVKDPGIGIASRFHEAIFDMFRRLHPVQAYGGGTGAGLAIARRLVRLHGGELWVDSSPGQGATFYFTLGRGPA